MYSLVLMLADEAAEQLGLTLEKVFHANQRVVHCLNLFRRDNIGLGSQVGWISHWSKGISAWRGDGKSSCWVIQNGLNIVGSELNTGSLCSCGSEQQFLEEFWLMDSLDLEVGSDRMVVPSTSSLTGILDADRPDTEPSFEPGLRQANVSDEWEEDVFFCLVDAEAGTAGWRCVLENHILTRNVQSSGSHVLPGNVALDWNPDQDDQTQSIGR